MRITIDYEKMGNRIRALRMQRNLTQESLAYMVDVNVSHISNIENAHTKVSLIVLVEIANALDSTVDYLLSDQYTSKIESPIDRQIMKALSTADEEKKEKILKIIEII